jgi:hypothetical protein
MFDLENGTFNVNSPSLGFVSAKIEDYGSGWYKCSMTLDPSQMSNSGSLFISFSVGITGNETNSFNGNGTSGIYIFGAQFEQQPYYTSYIPTNGSTVTRNQEAAFGSGNSSLINSTEGVLYAEIAALANNLTIREITLSDGTANNRVELRFTNNSNEIQVVVRAIDGAVQHARQTSAYTITSFNKIAFKYKLNDFAFWINGVEVATGTGGNTFSSNTLTELAFDNGNGDNDFFGKTKCVAVFEALTDAELTCLTTI